jgi:hypothetical protein
MPGIRKTLKRTTDAIANLKTVSKLISSSKYYGYLNRIYAADSGKRGDKKIQDINDEINLIKSVQIPKGIIVTNQVLKENIKEGKKFNSPKPKTPRKKSVKKVVTNLFDYSTLKNNILTETKTTYQTKNLDEQQKYDLLYSIVKVCSENMNSINSKIVLHVENENGEGDIFYTLSDSNIDSIIQNLDKSIVGTFEVEAVVGSGSDVDVILKFVAGNSKSLSIEFIKPSKRSNKKQSGAFFKYYSKLDYDLTRYGIFRNFSESNYEDTCLIHALKMGGLSNEKEVLIINLIKCREVPICKLPIICETLKIQINLKKISDKKNVIKYGNSEESYNIGLIEEHFFLIEQTELTSFSIEHFNDIKDLNDWNYIYKRRDNSYKKDKKRVISSFNVIELLIENKNELLEEIKFENSEIAATQFYNKVDSKIVNLVDVSLDDKTSVKKIEYKPKEKEEIVKTVFFDFETFTLKTMHVPYLCCYYDSLKNEKYSFYNAECGKQFLDHLVKNTSEEIKTIVIIAHNAGYDYNFLVRNLYRVSMINRGSHLISASGFYSYFFKGGNRKFKIEIKDSYNMISVPLRAFSSMFPNIECVKEVMPYELYNVEGNIKKRYIEIEEALKYVKPNEVEQFLYNIKRWGLEKDGKYDIIEYSKFYCEIDCEVLAKGYNTFNKWIKEVTELDTNNFLTLASLADTYLIKEGCYEDVYALSGISQMFIQGCVVGGRTMTNSNKMQKFDSEINELTGKATKMQDFDGVSLYPSAMRRMEGFLKGLPKVIKNLDYQNVKNYDGYFVDIEITKVGINRNFPLASFKNEEGVRMFENDLIGKEIRVDKISLEDLIEFQKVEFIIKRGYYFDEGFNNKVNEVIQHLFETRLQKKKEKNPIECIYKLLMNSSYGKSIMKAILEKVDIIDGVEEFENFLFRNYNWVKNAIKISDSKKYKIKSIKPVNTHFNRPHVGSMVLSWSKRIMNEVICTAEDNNLKIYYQDTDSLHILEHEIPKLAESYETKYKRQLIGKKLGQFHSDFSMDYKNEYGEKIEFKDVYAIKSIFLGKKSYIDILQGTNIKTGEIEQGQHIRMKGIPSSCILYTAEKYKIKPIDIFEMHSKAKVIDYDLTENLNKVNFKIDPDFKVRTLQEFTRYITFDSDTRNKFHEYKNKMDSKKLNIDLKKFNKNVNIDLLRS